MAERAQPVGAFHWVGVGAIGLVLCLTLLPLGAVAFRAEGASGLRASDWAVIRFTVVQAAVSAVLSVALAIPLARALARRQFRGRQALIVLLGAPFILPVIIAVLGILALFGRAGLVNTMAEFFGLPPIDIFGIQGVILAHVFLNLPLATRLLLGGWERIPTERFRLATSLGFTQAAMERHFHWPILREVVPGALLAIFLICTTSFAVALILGGGPRATTVELAIYQAFRFDFDLARAAWLGLIQVAICAATGLFVLRFALPRELGSGLGRKNSHWPGLGRRSLGIDVLALVLATSFLALPILMVGLRGLPAFPDLPVSVWHAALRSIIIAVVSAVLATSLALAIATASLKSDRAVLSQTISFLGVAVSPLVIGTGLFILLRPLASPNALALPLTALVNAIVALPFVLRALGPSLKSAHAARGPLAENLRLSGLTLWRHVYLPGIARPLGFGAGLAAAFSMGDLGVIALFSISDTATLPLEMFRLMGSYRTADAEAAALLLLILALGIFAICDQIGRRYASA